MSGLRKYKNATLGRIKKSIWWSIQFPKQFWRWLRIRSPMIFHCWIMTFPPFSGMASLDSSASGKMGVRAVIYYMMTTIIAVFIGICMVLIIHPGKGSKKGLQGEGKIDQIHATDAFMDLIRWAVLSQGRIFLCWAAYGKYKMVGRGSCRSFVNFEVQWKWQGDPESNFLVLP